MTSEYFALEGKVLLFYFLVYSLKNNCVLIVQKEFLVFACNIELIVCVFFKELLIL